jgi:hypothetical protein
VSALYEFGLLICRYDGGLAGRPLFRAMHMVLQEGVDVLNRGGCQSVCHALRMGQAARALALLPRQRSDVLLAERSQCLELLPTAGALVATCGRHFVFECGLAERRHLYRAMYTIVGMKLVHCSHECELLHHGVLLHWDELPVGAAASAH